MPCALLGIALLLALPPSARAAFGFSSFGVAAEKLGGAPVTQPGSHPYALRVSAGLNTAAGESDGDLRDLRLALPPGLLINPTAVSECTAGAFHTHRSSPFEASQSGEKCQNATQVGVVKVKKGGETRWFGLFNLAPPFGAAASLGASPFGTPLVFNVHLHEPDNLELALEALPQSFDLQSLELTIWGTPWIAGHDAQRGNCLREEDGATWTPSSGEQAAAKCLVFENAPAPESQIHSDLTMPTTSCNSTPSYSLSATSWQGATAAASATTPALTGICHKEISIPKVQLMTDNAAARTGMAFNLSVNDGGGILNPGGEALPPIKQAIVALPEGLTINPSLGAGLGSCAEAQFAAETAVSEPGAGCPNNSKIGDVTVEEALGLAKPLKGSLYLATPYANPFHTLLAVYMLARLPERGLIVRSEGKLEPDPRTGRLVATFDDLPRLLYEHFTLTLREGQRSTLVSPPTCGVFPSAVEMASWSEPTVPIHESSAFAINHGEGGGPCPSGGAPPFRPGLIAGSVNPTAGAFTPFHLHMTRADGEQEITSYSATFPPGLLAKIAGVGECPEAAIAAARARSGERGGSEELERPSCPASSRIGSTLVGYGVGGTLAWAPGALYLAGPYHGAPLSVVAVDSALIGPFDLGTVVVRAAIRIDPRTARAQIDQAGSDPIPHVLRGVPLHLRDIRVRVDRPGFTVNPTSCDPMAVSSLLGGAGADPFDPADDTTATSSERFQVLNCTVLGFKPKLSFFFKGGSTRGTYPSLHATYVPRAGDANLSSASVTFPPAVFLAQQHIHTVCTRAQFRNENCPADSAYGHATAITPLMDEPLSGPVYLRASSSHLPDVVADLRGRGIEIEAVGHVDSSRGGTRVTFDGLPDGAVTKFAMVMNGGRKGLLQLGGSLCARHQHALARLVAQSNATEVLHPALRAKCAKRGSKGRGR